MHVPPRNLQQVQLSITLLSYYWELGVFLDAKASKALRSANDTETFRDVSLTNNLILYAKRNEVGSWKRSLAEFLSFHVLAAHPFPTHRFPRGKRQDLMTSLASRKQVGKLTACKDKSKQAKTLERKNTISTYYSRGPPGLKDSNTSVLT